jgi:hypothetical protein
MSEQKWGASVRARIGLLRSDLGREPREREVAKAIAKKKYENLSPDHVKQAFDLGQEVGLVAGFAGYLLEQFTDVQGRPCWCGV